MTGADLATLLTALAIAASGFTLAALQDVARRYRQHRCWYR